MRTSYLKIGVKPTPEMLCVSNIAQTMDSIQHTMNEPLLQTFRESSFSRTALTTGFLLLCYIPVQMWGHRSVIEGTQLCFCLSHLHQPILPSLQLLFSNLLHQEPDDIKNITKYNNVIGPFSSWHICICPL
jgi:hypothetical protein